MDLKTAIKHYRDASGPDFQKPDKAKSYTRNDTWHLLSESGGLLAVVFTDGAVTHGPALNAWSRQLQLGMPAPRR